RERADTLGIAGRLRFAGPLTSRELSATYGAADLLVLPTRAETYGMVVAEALARGVPVVASGVGGVPDALGRGADGVLPGVLVRADDPPGLAYALRRWLTDGGHRRRLRTAARSRRATLAPWSQTAAELSGLLSRLDEPDGAERRTSG
ncbi:MAG: glycosyltransferase family 4 protein, partial [Actinomycetia bacterium]|nr:glycosyltransferase family 4 protein [Actinomycetes bacterium]